MKDMIYKPVTKQRWKDLEALFSQDALVNGCWCMYWRLKRKEFQRGFGKENKKKMKRIVLSGIIPGILGYEEKRPVAWCSVAPREDFPVLGRSPVLKPVDDKQVWSIVCFFVLEPYRKQGMMKKLIRGAMDYAGNHGAKLIEAYPVIRSESKDPRYQLYTGVFTTFRQMGFEVAAQRSKLRPVMRKSL
jgi:GNAT superfamily N-acetyltransferase